MSFFNQVVHWRNLSRGLGVMFSSPSVTDSTPISRIWKLMKYLYFWSLAFESSQCVFSVTICSNLCVPLCVCQLESICKFSCQWHSATHHTHTPSLWLSAGVCRAAVILGRNDFVQCVGQLSSMCVGFWAASDTFLSDFSGSVSFTGLVKCFTLQKPYQRYMYSTI